MKYYILYNPLAGHGATNEKLSSLEKYFPDGELVECNVTDVGGYTELLSGIDPEDKIVVSGGDGTLNNFINAMDTDKIENEVLYYASGSGNDFLHDLEKSAGCAPFRINQYLKNLPTVTVKGKSYKFLNGIGYGIDGWCCEIGDQLKAKGKAVNYTNIAIKGLIYAYKPRNATVNVDGKEFNLKKVWIAPTMNGRFYGGGMMPTPDQDRLGDGRVTFMSFYGSNKLKTLMIFPSLFKGEHVKHTECITVVKGDTVTVTFDRPCALQIDGETILDVTTYTVNSGRKI